MFGVLDEEGGAGGSVSLYVRLFIDDLTEVTEKRCRQRASLLVFPPLE